jgi:hypothetical protein
MVITVAAEAMEKRDKEEEEEEAPSGLAPVEMAVPVRVAAAVVAALAETPWASRGPEPRRSRSTAPR